VYREELEDYKGILRSGNPCVVTGEKNSPTVAHVCRKRRLKWVLPQVRGWATTLSL
jgi:hypothetical protein